MTKSLYFCDVIADFFKFIIYGHGFTFITSLLNLQDCLFSRKCIGDMPLHFLNACEKKLVSSNPQLSATSRIMMCGSSSRSRDASCICMAKISCLGDFPVARCTRRRNVCSPKPNRNAKAVTLCSRVGIDVLTRCTR